MSVFVAYPLCGAGDVWEAVAIGTNDLFAPFEGASYPCFLLDEQRRCVAYNAAAAELAPELCKENALRSLLENSLSAQRTAAAGKPADLWVEPPLCEQRGSLIFAPVQGGLFCFLQTGQNPAAPPPAESLATCLREPISAVFSYLPMLSRQVAGDGQALEYIEDISRSCYEMLRTANNLTIAGKAANGAPWQLQPCDISSLTRSLCQAADTVCIGHGVPINWEVEDGIVCDTSDYLYCTALANLLLNSLTYTQEENEVQVTLTAGPHGARLTVADRGLGIKPEVIGSIFDPYFSCDPYNDGEPAPSFGMGLTVAKAVFEASGGTMMVNSTFGEGTTIAVSLPLSSQPQTPLASRTADHLLNRFSPLYVQLCSICQLPNSF